MHWITVGPPTSPRCRSSCTRRKPPRPHRGRAPDRRRDDGQGQTRPINLATKDLDSAFERLQAGDADVVQEPTDQPYGVRDRRARPDPAGNMIRIQELR